jgi:hypothetical protein
MAEWIVWLGLAVLVIAGVLALARPRVISQEQYEEQKGKGSLVGNAMHALHDVLAPREAEALRKARTELTEEEPSGDPPSDDPPRPA